MDYQLFWNIIKSNILAIINNKSENYEISYEEAYRATYNMVLYHKKDLDKFTNDLYELLNNNNIDKTQMQYINDILVYYRYTYGHIFELVDVPRDTIKIDI